MVKKTNKKEWELKVDKILDSEDPQIIKRILKEYLWEELQKNESNGQHENNNNKSKTIDRLKKCGLSASKSIVIASICERTYYERKERGYIRKTRCDAKIYDPVLKEKVKDIFENYKCI